MTKDELIEALEDGRQEMVEMLDPLPERLLIRPGVCGEWSIRDILAHLTAWEGQVVTLLFQARQGVKQPSTVHFGKESDEVLNQRWHLMSLNRSLDLIWQDFIGIRKQTIRRINAFTDAELNNPDLYVWLKGTPLMLWIIDGVVQHEEEHGNQIRDWLDQLEESGQDEDDVETGNGHK